MKAAATDHLVCFTRFFCFPVGFAPSRGMLAMGLTASSPTSASVSLRGIFIARPGFATMISQARSNTNANVVLLLWNKARLRRPHHRFAPDNYSTFDEFEFVVLYNLDEFLT
jgi:hypothetical protein